MNEETDKVQHALNTALRHTRDLKIVTGYSSLETVITTLVSKCENLESVTLVFGNEPSPNVRESTLLKEHSLAEEAIEYWFEQGVSPRHCSAVIRVLELISEGVLTVRFHRDPDSASKMLHAKIVETDNLILTGSSNFSFNGLEGNREYNTCFRKDEAHDKSDAEHASGFVRFCIEQKSVDETDAFANTLRNLLAYVNWEQALSRAIHVLLGGEPNILANEKRDWDSMWPHQKDAVMQALSLMESHGGAIIADPTGSGKTQVGTWVTKLALRRYYARNQGRSTTWGATIICPSSVEDNWRREGASVGENFATVTHDALSATTNTLTTQLRDSGLRHSPIVAVDEIHNFYGKGARANRLKELNADEIALLTATPINRQFSDVIKLLERFFGPWATNADLKRLRTLTKEVDSPSPVIRKEARDEARELIQPYMVRRTRTEIQEFVSQLPEKYTDGTRRFRYPSYNTPTFELPECPDAEFRTYRELVDELVGIDRLGETIQMSSIESRNGMNPVTILRNRLASAKGLSQYNVWRAMDSSAARFVEHILGSAKAGRWIKARLGIDVDLTGRAEDKEGVIKKLEALSRPILNLDLSDEELNEVPDWLRDDASFQQAIVREIEIYRKLIKANISVVCPRDDVKLDLLISLFQSGNKILAFDHSICTVNYFRAALVHRGIELVDVFSSAQGKPKKSLVKNAERLYGKESLPESRIGLMNDLMSEGINLQGANTLVHLTTPTTIRQVEQRVGRIDRMDSPHDLIYVHYPSTDIVSEQMRPHLKERHELVDQLIRANIEVPEELMMLEATGIELGDFSVNLEHALGSINHGIKDAYASVRDLVGPKGIVSQQTHSEMRDVEKKIVSHVSFLKSRKPWALICYQSRSGDTHRWVLLDYDRNEAEDNRGILTDLNQICEFLVDVLPDSEDVSPGPNSDRFASTLIDHLARCEYFTLPQSQKKLADFLRECCDAWEHVSELDVNELRQVREAVSQGRTSKFDTSSVISEWNQILRDYLRSDDLRQSDLNPREFVINNPPEARQFHELRRSLKPAQPLDSRIQALIIGMPSTLAA